MALFFIGKPRPSIDAVIENIKLTFKNFSSHDIDSYLFLRR